MVELIVWLILFLLFGLLLLLLRYWIELLSTKESYRRDELISLLEILPAEANRLLGREPLVAALALLIGILVAWLLVLFGGLVTASQPPLPDRSLASAANYFFQSPALTIVLYLVWPALIELARSQPFVRQALIAAKTPGLLALSLSLAAHNLALWGIFHQLSFLIVLLLLLTHFAAALLLIYRHGSESYDGSSKEAYGFGYGDSDSDDFEVDLGDDHDLGDDLDGEGKEKRDLLDI